MYLSFYLEVDGEMVHTSKQKLLSFLPDPCVRLLSNTRSRSEPRGKGKASPLPMSSGHTQRGLFIVCDGGIWIKEPVNEALTCLQSEPSSSVQLHGPSLEFSRLPTWH